MRNLRRFMATSKNPLWVYNRVIFVPSAKAREGRNRNDFTTERADKGRGKKCRFGNRIGVFRGCLICIFFAPILLTGCWDKVELENRGFVITIGIDKDDGEKPFAVSMAIADVAAMSEKGGGKDKETVKSSKDKTLAAAMHTIDSQISQKIYYGHTKAVVISGKVMEDADMLREAVDALERNNEINQKIVIVATEDNAADILGGESKSEPLVGIYISDFYKNNRKNTASVSKLDLEHLIKSLRLTGSAIIPQVKLEEKQIKLGGTAVIKDFRLAGWMTDEEMRGLLWFNEQADGMQAVAYHQTDGKDVPVPLLVNHSKRTVSFAEEGGKLVCTVKLRINGTVEEYKLLSRSLFDGEKINQLQAEYEKVVSGELTQTFALFKEKYEIDGFLLKDYLKKWNYPLYLKYADDWDNAYKEMLFAPEVTVSVTNTGPVK